MGQSRSSSSPESLDEPTERGESKDGPADGSRSKDGPAHRRQSKVERIIEAYDLDGLGRELEDRWTGRGTAQQSLRELADFVNERLLASAMDGADATPLGGEVDTVYEQLTGEEVSEGTRTQTRLRLERTGVDVDRLLDDFVSHQAIYTYLTERRDVEYPSDGSGDDSVEKEVEKIQRLRSRTVAVIEDAVERMRKTDQVDVGDFDVLLDVRILCENCGTYHGVDELVDNGGCGCDES